MLPQNGGRPPPRKAGDDLPIDELPAKALANEFNAKRHAVARLVAERRA
jgi:hypothetical protein